jgi:hypothetical protein
MINRIGVRLLGAGMAIGVAACSGSSSPPPPLCPRVGIINGLESHEEVGVDQQVAYRTAMENVDGACRVDGDDLTVEIAIDVVVQPGEALSSTLVEVPYFVAISAPGGTLIDRQDFVARVEVPRGSHRAGVKETFRQRFLGREAGATDYEVLFGLTLPEAEAMRQYRGG